MNNHILVSSGWLSSKKDAWSEFMKKANQAVSYGYTPIGGYLYENRANTHYVFYQCFYRIPNGLATRTDLSSDDNPTVF